MNKLFIIGNGFDLAHDLNTKYSDFILWYLNDKFQHGRSDSDDDGLSIVHFARQFQRIRNFNSIDDFLRYVNPPFYTWSPMNEFFNDIV